MKDLTNTFLEQVLGPDGAKALKKAISQHPLLVSVLVPRTVIAWLEASPEGSEGDLPPGSLQVEFKKTEGSYTGAIKVGQSVCEFDSVSVYHLAAAISLALGEEPPKSQLKTGDIVNLGKSIDLLVKSRLLRAEASTRRLGKAEFPDGGQELPGPPAKPQEPKGPVEAEPPEKQKERIRPNLPKKPGGVKVPPRPKSTTLNLSEKNFEAKCGVCSGSLFDGRSFKGCMCFRDLAPFAKTEGDQLRLDSRRWDNEAIAMLIETIGWGGN